MCTLGFAVCLSALCGAITSGDGRVPAVQASVAPTLDMRGFWEHDACQVMERDGVRTGSRSLFAIFEREWGIAFTQFADAVCATPVMTAVLRGTYERTRASARVPGAAEVTFRFTHKGVVAHDAALVAKLNGGLCGARRWSAGVEQDVTSTGCLSIASGRSCPQEYDLAAIDGDRLYLGERPLPGEDICAEGRRPTRLRTVALRRR